MSAHGVLSCCHGSGLAAGLPSPLPWYTSCVLTAARHWSVSYVAQDPLVTAPQGEQAALKDCCAASASCFALERVFLRELLNFLCWQFLIIRPLAWDSMPPRGLGSRPLL